MKSALKNIGLSDKEIKIYDLISKEGAVSPAVISYRLNIPRSSCRYICDKLVNKKLAFSIKHNKGIIFKAYPVKKTVLFLQKHINQTKKEITDMQKAIKEMKNSL